MIYVNKFQNLDLILTKWLSVAYTSLNEHCFLNSHKKKHKPSCNLSRHINLIINLSMLRAYNCNN